MRTPPLLADFTHIRVCKPFCENSLTLPIAEFQDSLLQTNAHILGIFVHGGWTRRCAQFKNTKAVKLSHP